MKVKVEVKDGNKITSYTADFEQAEEVVKGAVEKLGGFLKTTFKKETYTKDS